MESTVGMGGREWDVVNLKPLINVLLVNQSEELRQQLETEQHYCFVYKNQANDMRLMLEENTRAARDAEQERSSLLHQLQLAIARADSEAIARSVLHSHTYKLFTTLLSLFRHFFSAKLGNTYSI